MQVLTLNTEAFDAKCEELARLVRLGHPKRFDATVAIRTGGAWVCDAIEKALPTEYLGERHDVTLQRPSTKAKNATAGKILPLFPIFILDAMRMAESVMLRLRRKMSTSALLPEVTLDNRLAALLSETESPEILVIDDAVDSGTTLAAVIRAIVKANPAAKIKSAVITATTSTPVARPDFSLYSNHTLIRFPWSKDFLR